MTPEPTLGDLIQAAGERRARLAAAMDATQTAPSASQTPVRPEVGSQDDRTPEGLSGALVAAIQRERAAIVAGIKTYFSPVGDGDVWDDPWGDVLILCGRIERGEYGAAITGGGQDA